MVNLNSSEEKEEVTNAQPTTNSNSDNTNNSSNTSTNDTSTSSSTSNSTTISDVSKNVTDKISNISLSTKDGIDSAKKTISESLETITSSTKASFDFFNLNSYKQASENFMKSSEDYLSANNIVAKFSFLILILLIFIFLLRVGINLASYIFAPKDEPTLINGMIPAKQMMIIDQDPSKLKSIPIKRSVNQQDGIEFSWSVWIMIDDITYNEHQFRHIFNKGNNKIITDTNNKDYGIIQPNNAPGLYISPYKNNLVVVMNTFNNINEKIEIEEIPINKWLCVIIKCENKTLDVFINGTLVKRHIMSSVPKQNYGNVNVALNGGFSGYISSLKYHDRGLNMLDIASILYRGPNRNLITDNIKSNDTSYLSTKWYFNQT